VKCYYQQIPYFDHHFASPGDATPDPKQVWRCHMGRGEGHADDEQKLAVNGEHWWYCCLDVAFLLLFSSIACGCRLLIMETGKIEDSMTQ